MTERELREAVAKVTATCRSAWPGIDLADETFVEFLRPRVPPGCPPARFLSSVAFTDLFLACGCAAGNEAAAAAFRRRFAPQIATLATRFAVPRDLADELLHELYCRLFLAPAPRIAGYAGDGPLDTWIRVVAARMTIDLVRRQTRQTALTDSVELRLDRLEDDAGSILVEHSHRRQLKAAFEHASRALTGRERAVLRYSLDGASADQIARIYGVHRVSVARWLGAIRDKLRTSMCACLTSELDLTASGAERAVMSIDQITLSLDRLLPRAEGAN